ncbi:UNVERIFIED_CONTAM: Sulfite oxidase [Sesamum radiatum]|uniref:Sulfite oxidase n=1 Tax=Sesamum radiatum TaxID=300843 RepID=A0AAW2RAM0_SESRA
MPGLTAPSDYAQEPPRHPALVVNSKLAESAAVPFLSLNPFLRCDYAKNVLGGENKMKSILYSFYITGLIGNPKELFMKDIWKLQKYNVTATLQCAGNRRTAMSRIRKVKGVGWDVAAIGNAVWSGAKLADVLELVGIPKCSHATPSGGKHVEFVSIDKCKEENGGPYKASIPLSQATNPEADVLLAYEMNGETLNRDHGYPLRVIVPGVIGARSVKWLDSINIIEEECQCAICSLDDVNMVKPGKMVSVQLLQNTVLVKLLFLGNLASHTSDSESSDKWAWVLFEAEADIRQSTEIVAKAVDIAGNVQPENVEVIWNLRGYLTPHGIGFMFA